MKTISEIFRFSETVRDAIEALEAREKELLFEIGGKALVEKHYPPPKPETLPAGYWWWRISPEYSWVCSFQREDFTPILREYRPWNDPPPEVAGKAEPTGQFTCCACEKTFPMMSRSAHVATICTGCYVSGNAVTYKQMTCQRCNGTGEVPDEYDPLPDDVI